MKELKILKFAILGVIFLALTGCFSVELNAPDQVTQNTIFTAEAITDGADGDVTYKWKINNTLVSEAAVYHTMATQIEDFTLSIEAKDASGNEDSKEKVIKVVPQLALNDQFTFTIDVSDKSGFAIPEANVTVNGVSIVADAYGTAIFENISQTNLMIVTAQKDGYLKQSYQYNFEVAQNVATANLTLQKINEESHLVDSTLPVEVVESQLNTKLSLPENSFVTESGEAVTGEVEITITPIDVRSVGNSFLGGAQALTNAGDSVVLITAGMADFQFSSNGQKVNLADGVIANIEMDLVIPTGDDGRVFAAGDSIEMWWFDDEKGLWIEDGVGTLQESDTSPTGLKLVAEVTHFTTWNWDYYKDEDRASVKMTCLKDGAQLSDAESCLLNVSAVTINQQYSIGKDGATAINLPPGIEYKVKAKIPEGNEIWLGEDSIVTVPGENTIAVDLQLADLYTGHTLCRVIDDTSVEVQACDIEMFSAVGETFNTGDFADSVGEFKYMQDEVIEIKATLSNGLSQTKLVDTALVNGQLIVETIFFVGKGTLTCRASLNNTDHQEFPCDAIITDDSESQSAVFEQDFFGVPVRAEFLYNTATTSLDLQVASMFDAGIIGYNKYRDYYYINGSATNRFVDLEDGASDDIVVNYNVSHFNLYTVKCKDLAGNDVDCTINWYTPMEQPVIWGPLSDLYSSTRKPTWMRGKAHLEQTNGFGDARNIETGDYNVSHQFIVDNEVGIRELVFYFDTSSDEGDGSDLPPPLG